MNIRPWQDDTTLPLPLLGVQHAREFAPTQAHVHPFGGCDCSLGLDECQCMCRPAQPAEACTELGAHAVARATKPPRVIDTLRRQRSITGALFIALGAAICAVCIAGYLRVPS
jgi:hypothetical protein